MDITDRHQLEAALRSAMAYQGYLLVRDSDAGPRNQERDRYMVVRRADVVFGSN